jgi:hypothetical protein
MGKLNFDINTEGVTKKKSKVLLQLALIRNHPTVIVFIFSIFYRILLDLYRPTKPN